MLDVVMLALGLGFFLAAVGYAHASEEDENDPRLFTRRPRRCRLAVFLDVRPAAARAILTPVWFRQDAHMVAAGALMTPTSMHVPVEEEIEINLP